MFTETNFDVTILFSDNYNNKIDNYNNKLYITGQSDFFLLFLY